MATTMTTFLVEQSQLMREIGGHVHTMDDGLSILNLAHHESPLAVYSLPVGYNKGVDLVRNGGNSGHPTALEGGEQEEPGREHAGLLLHITTAFFMSMGALAIIIFVAEREL
jgi:hypothetical protein